MWVNPKKNIKGMRLDLGSGNPSEGERRPEGYVLNDIDPHDGIDLVCDILNLKDYVNPESCSRIRISHVLEHFGNEDCHKVLDIIYSLLENDGILEVSVPNFMYFVQLALQGDELGAITHAYGGQLDKHDFHRNGFTPITLIETLREHNFKIVSIMDLASITCEAIK